ncbi:MAG TPA: di-heme enzyme [Bryobacteraceae bacterium]|nr:di-heme enzyme [Bryobacteraceae bacterium]
MTLRRPGLLSLRKFTLLLLAAANLFAADWDWRLPPGFPKPVIPAANPMSASKVELGRYLFYDTRMSVNGKASCATCHQQSLAFTDGRAHARGATGELHPRSSMSLVNVAYAPRLTWADPELDSLEKQALTPMLGEHPVELGLKGGEERFLAAVKRDTVYRRLFPLAFPGDADPYTIENVTRAIAAFERTIVSMRSPYDRYRWDGDASAISASAKRGELLFSSSERAGCFQCHGGWNFAAVRFAGSPERDSEGAGFFNTGVTVYKEPNRGIYEYTKRTEDTGKFRPPTLRNIAVTAPYMHDGSIATLDQVLEHYEAGGRLADPNKTHILRPFRLSPEEKNDLIEFLKSLTDEELLHDPRWSDPWPARPK